MVAHPLWERTAAGSNPVIPTLIFIHTIENNKKEMTDHQITDHKNSTGSAEILEQSVSEKDLNLVQDLNEKSSSTKLQSEDDDEDLEEFAKVYFDEDGNPKALRDNLIGNHKIASSVLIFEAQLPDYLLEMVNKRINDLEDDDWDPAMVGTSESGEEVPEIRKCEVTWLTELDWVSTIFTHYYRIANRELWEYDLTEMEEIQVTKYNKNHFYGWHCDYGTSGDKELTRKLSASIILSDPNEYSGGKLQFLDWHGKVVTPTKKKGSIIIFDSRTPHRVTPVLKGQRISLVSWMLGPKLK